MRRSFAQPTLSCAFLFCLLSLAPAARAANIVVSGFNEDVVTENAATHFGHRFDLFTPNPTDWVENGLAVGGHTAVGLPTSGTFTSATGSGVVYHLQPYNGNNALRMGDGDPASGTLNVAAGRYSFLHILAASSTDGSAAPKELGQSSDITLNFADGSVTLPQALVAYDWNSASASQFPPPTAATVNAAIALGGLDRNELGAGMTSSTAEALDTSFPHAFAMYETTLNLGALGLSGRILQSVAFNDVNALHGATGVFAVDGTPAPEPSAVSLIGLGILLFGLYRLRSSTL
jgi:hypothetical protein